MTLSPDFGWKRIGHSPTQWGLGEAVQGADRLFRLRATATRQKSGKWAWRCHPGGVRYAGGEEPSADLAMAAAEKAFRSFTELEAVPVV